MLKQHVSLYMSPCRDISRRDIVSGGKLEATTVAAAACNHLPRVVTTSQTNTVDAYVFIDPGEPGGWMRNQDTYRFDLRWCKEASHRSGKMKVKVACGGLYLIL